MKFEIKTNFPQVQKKLDSLQAGIRNRALASAVNKTLDQAETKMVRSIAAEFNVTSAYVRQRLRLRRARAKDGISIEGGLIGGGRAGAKRSANIIAFVEKKTSLAEARRRRKAGTLNQLFVKVKRGGPAKPIKGAFIGNKGRTVFEREGKSRLPIKPVQTIDVAQMFNTQRINRQVIAMLKAKFPQIVEREVRFFVTRFNRGGR